MLLTVITGLLSLFIYTINLNAAVILEERTFGDFVVTIKQSFENNVERRTSETRVRGHPKADRISYTDVLHTASTNGWTQIKGWTDPTYNNEATAYHVALNEASLTTNFTYEYWTNSIKLFCDGQTEVCDKIRAFIKHNTRWVKSMVDTHKAKDEYWWQVGLVYKNIQGFIEGYKKFKSTDLPDIPEEDFWFMNLRGELYDLVNKYSNDSSPYKFTYYGLGTAIVKLLPGNKDLVVGQNAWFGYNTMTRVAKRYHYYFQKESSSELLVPGQIMTFSGYPSTVNSIDEFYVISSNLVVVKTSVKNYNDKLWEDVHPECVFEFVRSLVANRLATNGKSWEEIFTRYNSGTSNSQWMIVDYNTFSSGYVPKEGLLRIVEQIPGLVKAEDVTAQLSAKSYWASYNIPYNKEIYQQTNQNVMAKKYGSWFSYEKSPRAAISKRDHTKIKCINTLVSFMRSNNFNHDRLSKCQCHPSYSAANAIAGRLDLNKGNGSYPFPYLARHPGGAVDVKVVNESMSILMNFIGVSGPSTGTNLPKFQWSESGYKNISHIGQPDVWNFKPTLLVDIN